jgi:HlyD family secretion protein
VALTVVVVGLLGTAGAAWGVKYFQPPGAKKYANLMTEVVTRAPLEISITEKGSLESANNLTLTCLVEGEAGTGILTIVPEGTLVTKDQVLVELDSSRLRNDLTTQEIKVEEAQAALTTAEKDVEIQQSQNESDIAAAELKLEIARLDLAKYKDENGEYTQLENELQGDIAIAKEDVTRATEKLKFTQRMIRKGYAQQSELDADRIALAKAEIALGVAQDKLTVLQKFTQKRQLAELEAAVKDNARELERVKKKAEAAMATKQADLRARKLTYDVEKDKKEKLVKQLDACIIKAPRDGLVVYANARSSGFRGNEPLIYEGAKVKERQAIINLPDVANMQVNTRIHESKIAMIREGLTATIKTDARPGEIFHGVVNQVSLTPMSANWPNFNLKEYLAYVKLTDAGKVSEVLKPGLSAEVEILVDRIDSAVQERGGKHFAWVHLGDSLERREVKIGRSSENVSEILDGLKEGERVVQTPRTQIPREVLALEEEVPAAAAPVAVPGAAPADNGKKNESPGGRSGGSPGGAAPGGGRGRGGNFDPAQVFAMMDANKDGKVTLDEVPEDRRQFFDISRMDKDGDKAVSQEEFTKAMEEFRRNMQQRAGASGASGSAAADAGKADAARGAGSSAAPGAGAPGAGAPGGGQRRGFGDPSQIFASMDANKDGKISEDEVPEDRKRFFNIERMDKDGDKAVSQEEFTKAMEEFRRQFQQQGGGAPGASDNS